MGRFLWSQGHSKQGSDKLHAVAHDWFSKESSEPSRQALNDLMKEYSGVEPGNGDDSPKAGKGRSRSNTVNSSFSLYARSVSDGSNDLTSRPSSQQSFVDTGLPFPERHEHPAKSLLAKGTRMLKRQGSKLNLLPSQLEERPADHVDMRVGEVSPVRGLQRQPTITARRTGLKRSISGPFAFQHLTHGDQAHFQSLDTVSRTDMTNEFHAIQADQHPDDQIRGIPVSDLPVKTIEVEVKAGSDEPMSPTTDAIPYLPITPPRPLPPPKDVLKSPYSPTEFRMSRSMENFSRPTRLSVTANDISPTDTTGKLSALSPINRNSVVGKPLPLLPDVVHAVSTRDDIALPLRTAPLPSPPKPVMEVVEEEKPEEKDSVSAILESALRPHPLLVAPMISREHKRRSQSSGEIHFDPVFYGMRSPTTTLEACAPVVVAEGESPKSKNRISIGVKAIDIEDWEDAIDYSWDHAVDPDDAERKSTSDATVGGSRAPSIPNENYLVVEQSTIDEASSSASTPLMMQGPPKPFDEQSIPGPRHPLEEEPSSPLLGLGIGSLQPVPALVSLDETAAPCVDENHEHRFSSTDAFRPRVMRSPISTMSKSSSQESIILSIASSIIGTHRSSNSSTSLSDFAHLANFGDSMENLKLDLQDFTSTPDMHFREGSQDTIREEPQAAYDRSMTEAVAIDMSMPYTTSPTVKHDRGASTSQIPIPERKSSMPGVEASKTQIGRKRAGTGTTRPRRNTRVSYSLFPTPAAT